MCEGQQWFPAALGESFQILLRIEVNYNTESLDYRRMVKSVLREILFKHKNQCKSFAEFEVLIRFIHILYYPIYRELVDEVNGPQTILVANRLDPKEANSWIYKDDLKQISTQETLTTKPTEIWKPLNVIDRLRLSKCPSVPTPEVLGKILYQCIRYQVGDNIDLTKEITDFLRELEGWCSPKTKEHRVIRKFFQRLFPMAFPIEKENEKPNRLRQAMDKFRETVYDKKPYDRNG